MAVSTRQKASIAALAVYWVGIFFLSHIRMPELAYEAQVSDKSLHFAAYLVLVFWLWFSIRPDEKVRWRKGTVWWVLAVVVWYGVVDELLQGYVGRSRDATDFLMDVAGACTGVILFAFFTFWAASLIVTGITVFLLTNVARANLGELLPVTSMTFHLLAYGLFTMLWIRYVHLRVSARAAGLRWLIAALVPPTGFLLTVKLFSVILGRNFSARNVMISAAGIAVVIITVSVLSLYRGRLKRGVVTG